MTSESQTHQSSITTLQLQYEKSSALATRLQKENSSLSVKLEENLDKLDKTVAQLTRIQKEKDCATAELERLNERFQFVHNQHSKVN